MRPAPSARLVPTVLGLLVAAHVAVAQSAAEIGTEQNTLSTLIPPACDALCADWLGALGTCPVATSPTYSACVCDQTFVNNFATCAPCLATQLTATNDAVNAATANQAPADLTNYCATAGNVVTTATDLTSSSTTTTETTSSSTSLTETSSIVMSSVVTTTGGLNGAGTVTFTPTTPLLTFSTVSTASSSSAASGTATETDTRPNGPVTMFQSGDDMPFPTQTKSTNAFANGAARNGRDGSAAVAVAAVAVAGGWMLA